MKVRSLTSVLSRLDDFNALKLIYLGQFLGLVENFKISTSVLYVEGDQIASSGLDKFFRILTLVLKVENYQMAFFWILTLILDVKDDQATSSRLKEVFRILTMNLNVEDDELAPPVRLVWS